MTLSPRTTGAWIIGHSIKLRAVDAQGQFTKIDAAGKAGTMLSVISATQQEALSRRQVETLATANGISMLELSSVLSLLEDRHVWDALNAHIEDVTKYVDDSTRSSDPSGAIRLICLTVAFIMIALDFNLREAIFMQPSHVASRIEEGLRFGTRGRAGVMTLLDALGKKKKSEALRVVETVRAEIPAEFFHRHAGTGWFFDVARTLDSAAYSIDFVGLTDLPPEAQSAVGVILDFLGIDRRVVFRVKSAGGGKMSAAY